MSDEIDRPIRAPEVPCAACIASTEQSGWLGPDRQLHATWSPGSHLRVTWCDHVSAGGIWDSRAERWRIQHPISHLEFADYVSLVVVGAFELEVRAAQKLADAPPEGTA